MSTFDLMCDWKNGEASALDVAIESCGNLAIYKPELKHTEAFIALITIIRSLASKGEATELDNSASIVPNVFREIPDYWDFINAPIVFAGRIDDR